MTNYNIRIITIGDMSVGKTSIIHRYLYGSFTNNVPNTIGLDFEAKNYDFDEDKAKVCFIDTAGQERFKSINRHFLKKINGVIGVYSKTDRNSFERVEDWFDEVSEYSDVIYKGLLGNKCDCDEALIRVSKEEGTNLAKKLNCSFFETSALTGENINKSIDDFVYNLYLALKKKNCPIDNNKNISLNNKEKTNQVQEGRNCCSGKNNKRKENKNTNTNNKEEIKDDGIGNIEIKI